MELKCPSYDYVLDMSWREFSLRLHGYKREYKEKWMHTREIAYNIYLSIPTKGKKVSIDKFMNISGKKPKSGLSDQQRELLKEAHKKALVEAKK